MTRNPVHHFLRNCVCLLLIICPGFISVATVRAQTRFGIDLGNTETQSPSESQLNQLRQDGFKYLIIHGRLDKSTLQVIRRDSFLIYPQLPYYYLTGRELTKNYGSILKTDLNLISYYDSLGVVNGYLLFREGQLHNRDFVDWVRVLNGDLTKKTRKKLYFISSYKLTSVPSGFPTYLYLTSITGYKQPPDSTGIYKLLYLQPNPEKSFSLRDLNNLLVSNQASSKYTIFLSYQWYASTSAEMPSLKKMIQTYAHNQNAFFATPPSNKEQPSANWIVLLLLIIWIIFSIHYNFEPNYRKAVVRYFGYHSFFISDLVDRLSRLTVSNLIVLSLESLSGGIFLYAIALYFLSPGGLQAISYHIPMFKLFGHSWIMFLVFGTIVAFLYNILCFMILIISSLKLNNFSQILTVYIWPQQLNLLVVSALVPIVLSGGSVLFVYILTSAFLLILIASYYMAAMDCSKLAKHPSIFRLSTMGIHALGLIALISWVITYSGLPDIWSLAVSLP